VAEVAELDIVPQPEAGLSIQETPPALLSLLTEAVIVTALDPAGTVFEDNDVDSETPMGWLPLPQAVRKNANEQTSATSHRFFLIIYWAPTHCISSGASCA
jgi:hypothetical protein